MALRSNLFVAVVALLFVAANSWKFGFLQATSSPTIDVSDAMDEASKTDEENSNEDNKNWSYGDDTIDTTPSNMGGDFSILSQNDDGHMDTSSDQDSDSDEVLEYETSDQMDENEDA